MKTKLFYKSQNYTGEGITFHSNTKSLLWVDIENKELYQYHLDTNIVTLHKMPQMVSTIIPWKQELVILGLQGSLVSYHLKTKELKKLVDIEPNEAAIRPNDGKASPDGRIFLGVMNMTNYDGTGKLYRIDTDFSVHLVLENQSIPNGIVWSKDGKKMYYNDTGRNVIEEYAYDAATGEIDYQRVSVVIPEGIGGPDGMTIDDEDHLWVAHWGGSGIYVWNPIDGTLIDRVSVPVPNPASCTFGTEGKLYITSARAGLSEKELSQYPNSGSVYVAQTEVIPGKNNYSFKTR